MLSGPVTRLALGLLLPWLAACTATVVRPEAPTVSRTVLLLDHGRHSSLLLTAADQSQLRYAYGDWAWYVEHDQGLGSGARALLWPSPAAFGRQHFAAERPNEALEAVLGIGIARAHLFQVDGEQVDALLEALERRFHDSSAEPQFSPSRQLHFVPHPRPYTLRHNSNHKVAGWLRQLGIEVRGSPALGRWHVVADTATE